jgi:anti-sigma B factor antagonist
VERAFSVTEWVRGKGTVVRVSGEVDVATAPALRDCLGQVIERDAGIVVVDLLRVTFIDSTGLGVLIGARKRCVEDGRELRIVVDEPRILKVLDITGLTELFAIHPTLDLALTE